MTRVTLSPDRREVSLIHVKKPRSARCYMVLLASLVLEGGERYGQDCRRYAVDGGLLSFVCGPAAAAVRIEGQVQAGGSAVANSTVTLWAASAGEPKQLAQTQTGSDGHFQLGTQETVGNDAVLYLVAKGGVATIHNGTGNNPAIALLAVLGNTPPAKVVINEMTTVASV
jgi:hypothetical protein